jgi:hypothetical protein
VCMCVSTLIRVKVPEDIRHWLLVRPLELLVYCEQPCRVLRPARAADDDEARRRRIAPRSRQPPSHRRRPRPEPLPRLPAELRVGRRTRAPRRRQMLQPHSRPTSAPTPARATVRTLAAAVSAFVITANRDRRLARPRDHRPLEARRDDQADSRLAAQLTVVLDPGNQGQNRPWVETA